MSEMVPTGKRLQILELLMMHGKLNPKQVEQLGKISKGTANESLARLEVSKLVHSSKDEHQTGRGSPHRWYEITALGEQAVEMARREEAMRRASRRLRTRTARAHG